MNVWTTLLLGISFLIARLMVHTKKDSVFSLQGSAGVLTEMGMNCPEHGPSKRLTVLYLVSHIALGKAISYNDEAFIVEHDDDNIRLKLISTAQLTKNFLLCSF